MHGYNVRDALSYICAIAHYVSSNLAELTDAIDASSRRTEELHLDLVNATREVNLLLERIDHGNLLVCSELYWMHGSSQLTMG